MKQAYRPQCGHILMEAAKRKRLDRLTAADSWELARGKFRYDRRRSFSKPKNRVWADGIDW
jgi:hypothetical protein